MELHPKLANDILIGIKGVQIPYLSGNTIFDIRFQHKFIDFSKIEDIEEYNKILWSQD